MTAQAVLKQEGTENNKNLMLIEFIKILPTKKAEIRYRKTSDESSETITYEGNEEVTEAFFKTFQDNKEAFNEIVSEFKKTPDKITINSLKFDYGKSSSIEKVLFTVKYQISKDSGTVINILTPLIPFYKDDFADTTIAVSGKHIKKIEETIDKARAYIKGDTRTKQMKLVVDNTTED